MGRALNHLIIVPLVLSIVTGTNVVEASNPATTQGELNRGVTSGTTRPSWVAHPTIPRKRLTALPGQISPQKPPYLVSLEVAVVPG